MTVTEAIRHASAQLHSESARLDAELLLCHVMQVARSWLYAWPDSVLTHEQLRAFETLLGRRVAGEPIAHIIGERDFWSLKLKVTPATLIPRPDTELLVERALALLPKDSASRVADLGTGSGAIALAIARERPACRIVAVDYSHEALAVAQENARRNQITNVEFRQGSWCAPLGEERFSLLVSNPPYIAEGDLHLEEGDVRFEPRSALVAGVDGLDDIRTLARDSLSHLQAGGWLLLEHGYDQGERVRHILQQQGFVEVATWRDLAGHERVTGGRFGG